MGLLGNVRFVPKADIFGAATPNDAERFRASKIAYQFELGDKLDRQVAGFGAFGDLVDKRRGNVACDALSADDVPGQRLSLTRSTVEETMMRSALLLVAALLSGVDRLAAQEAVEARGITPSIKLEETVYGHMDMEAINGKFQNASHRSDVCPRSLPRCASPCWPWGSICAFR
jgi:hypothetical protein